MGTMLIGSIENVENNVFQQKVHVSDLCAKTHIFMWGGKKTHNLIQKKDRKQIHVGY